MERDCPPDEGVANWSGKNQSPFEGFIRWVDYSECDYIEMHQIYVREEDREKGYGKKLMLELENIVKEKGIDWIYIASTATDEQTFGAFLNNLEYKRIPPPPFENDFKLNDHVYHWKKCLKK